MISIFSILFSFPAEIRCLCCSWFCCLFSYPATLCLPWYSQFRKVIFFSLIHMKRQNIFLTWHILTPASWFFQMCFFCFCASALPFSSCRYFWFLLPRQSNLLSTHPVILLIWWHKCRYFWSFCICRESGERMKGGRNSEEKGNSACLCSSLPMVYHGGQTGKFLCTEKGCPSSPFMGALLCPSHSSPFLCSPSRSLCVWKHSRHPIIVFSRVNIASLTTCIFA